MTQSEITRRTCNVCGFEKENVKGTIGGGQPFAGWWILKSPATDVENRFDVCGEVCHVKFAAGRLNNLAATKGD